MSRTTVPIQKALAAAKRTSASDVGAHLDLDVLVFHGFIRCGPDVLRAGAHEAHVATQTLAGAGVRVDARKAANAAMNPVNLSPSVRAD
jgi:hypothetical protein